MNTSALDDSIRILNTHRNEWATLPLTTKQGYLRTSLQRQVALAGEQVAAATAAKGIPGNSPLEGEEWASGPYCTARYLNLLLMSLERIRDHDGPLIREDALRLRRGGQLAVKVFPSRLSDRLLYRGFRGEVWMQRGVTRENLGDNMAGFYRRRDPQGRVTLVLGAGNVGSIGFLDVFTKLYVDGHVCLLKPSPVSAYLQPFLEEILGEFIRDGFVQLAPGGPEVGEYLCGHPGIDEIHITGNHLTHDAIVFGDGDDGRMRKSRNLPRLGKRVSSELGNVSPVIVVPGPWSDADLEFQCANIATQMINNGGFNCCAAKVLILPREWNLSAALMQKLRTILAASSQRPAFYPGAQQRYDRFLAASKTAMPIGPAQPGVLPWTLIPDVDPSDRNNICFTTESFCGLMAQTALPGGDAATFLRNAVEFCNTTLWGTLSACVIIHPKTERALGTVWDEAVAALRYGSIGINHWPVLCYALGEMSWGAYPGHTPNNIQSGTGVVHNASLFDKPEKSVLRGPFRVRPTPPWFITNRQAHRILPELLRLEVRPTAGNMLRLLLAAIKA